MMSNVKRKKEKREKKEKMKKRETKKVSIYIGIDVQVAQI